MAETPRGSVYGEPGAARCRTRQAEQHDDRAEVRSRREPLSTRYRSDE